MTDLTLINPNENPQRRCATAVHLKPELEELLLKLLALSTEGDAASGAA